MNKKEITECIYKKLQIKRFAAYNFIDLLIETLRERLLKGEKIVLSNFGTFKIVKRKKKKVINPSTKKEMVIQGRKIVKFLPSKNLKNL